MVIGREPVGEIEHDAGKEARLGDPEQKADDAKTCRSGDQRGQTGEQAPGNHNAGDPEARAHLLQNHVAGHLKDEIAPVEGAESEPIGGGGDAEIVTHRQRCETDIDPVDVGQKIAQDRERQQADIDFPHGRFFYGVVHSFILPRSRRDHAVRGFMVIRRALRAALLRV